MRFSATVFLSFVASALAYSVSVPSQNKGWTTSGPQRLVWERVDTDAPTFAVVLTNLDYELEQVLEVKVDGSGSGGSIHVGPPQGGWTHTGGGFRVNLVKDTPRVDVNTIYAQSSEFTIA